MGTIFGIIGLLIAGYFIFQFAEGFELPTISANMGYGLLLLVGLLTGFHCVGMCGGFVVSYATKSKSKFKSHFEYGLGKTIGYAAIGGLFGLFGSFIAFTPQLRGYAALFAGLFLVIFGLNMLNRMKDT